jgi:TPR repeat protein
VLTGPTPKSGNLLLERGRGLLDQGNIAGARLFLERAANAESAEAALLLGSTFDPKWLQNRGVLGVAADPARARKWYLEAQRLGSSDAAARLSGLEPERR